MIRSITHRTTLALALALPLAACDSDSGTDADTGSVSILLTDAAGDYQAAVVTISKIYLQGDGGEVVLMDTAVTTDLLTLANDVATLAEDVVVPAGTYDQLRFVIEGGYVVVENGDGSTSVYATADYAHVPAELAVDGELVCPSCAQSGLKVDLPGSAASIEGEQALLVDFDVAQSYGHEAGASGKWVMHPVIKAAELGLTGSVVARLQLADSVTLPVVADSQVTLADFKARLTNGEGSGEELELADGDGDGTFDAEFMYLIPGDYTVEFATETGVTFTLDLSEHPAPVTVGSGQRAEVDAVVTSAAAPSS